MDGRKVTVLFLLAALVALVSAAAAGDPLPQGWMGGNTQDYDVGLDRKTAHAEGASAYIKAKTAAPESFGTIVQSFSAEKYLGQRVRMTAFVKADKITDWAGLWMRVDGEGKDEVALSFDNMQSRPIKGTSDWKKYEIVLDIPGNSRNITFGILLSGPGQAWLDDFAFETVGKDVPVTSLPRGASAPEPKNLDFEG
jgi:hypothetical protein